jgi:glycosyltransferase involved in cell wall biosynthesis
MEGTQYQLSVVVPAYNAAATLGEQLQALSTQVWSQPWELIVVNNRCTDNTVDIARAFALRMPSLRIVEAPDRAGAAYAMNTGVLAAQSDAVAFCDADDVVADGWVAAMGDGLKQHRFVSGPLETELLNHSSITRNRPNAQAGGVQSYTYPPFLQHAGSGNMGMRREVYELVVGFDESFETLFDTDFCWKAQLRGVRLVALPDAVVHVRHRDRVRALLRQARKYAEYDVALYKRYRPLGMPRLSRKSGLSAWIGLVVHVLDVMHDETRARYLWDLGWRTGRLYGSLKYRVWGL